MKGTFWTRYEFLLDRTTFRVTKYENSKTGETVKVDVVQHWINSNGDPGVYRSTHPNLESVVGYVDTLMGWKYAQRAMKALRLTNYSFE